MTTRSLAIASILTLAIGLAGSAQAANVAGWDFSQYFSDGLLTIDGSTVSSTLDANYSSFDPTNNAGAEAAAFGQATLGAGVVPTAGSLSANLGGSASVLGENSFDSHSVLAAEGQAFTEYLGLTAQAASDVVFEADLSSLGDPGFGWSVSFAGKTLSGTSTVDISFSADGQSYTSFGSVNLGTDEAVYDVPLGQVSADTAYVRLGLDPSSGQPVIDNVAVNVTFVPEPSMALQLVAGVTGLMALARFKA